VPANSKHNNDQFDTDVDHVGNHYADQLTRLNRLDVRAFAPRRRARPPISSEKIDPDSHDDRLPLFLEPEVQAIDDEARLAELEAERRDVGGLSTDRSRRPSRPLSSEMHGAPRVRRRSFFPGLVLRTGAMMAVAALIAGMLVFKQDLFKELGLLTSEMKNGIARITTAVSHPTNNIAGAFAAIPVAAATTEESASDPEASARAMDQLKRYASTLALASDDPSPPKGAVNSYATVSPGKTDSQERAVDVRDSPRVIDQAELATLVVPPVTAAPPVATAPPRRLDADELATLLKRAKNLIAMGDIAPARLLLERAAEAQDASAALLLAQTYDPAVLGTQDIRRITPDPAMARSWYEKAIQFGSEEAQQRLAQMQN
jgi:hypothetical protein